MDGADAFRSLEQLDPTAAKMLPIPPEVYAPRLIRAMEAAMRATLAPGERLDERLGKERIGLLLEAFKIMRGDMRWTFARSTAELETALRRYLLSVGYEPSKRMLFGRGRERTDMIRVLMPSEPAS